MTDTTYMENRDMTFSFERKGAAGILNCEGSLTTDHALNLRDALMICIENSDHVIVNCRDLKSMDTPCIQIFCIAYRMAIRAQKSFSITGMHPDIYAPISEEIGQLCSSQSTLGCNKTCLWVRNSGPAAM